jgi:hypothetical protein
VEVVEVDICFEFVNQIDGQLGFSVSEGAIVSVFTFATKTGSAELGPIFIGVVELFDSCVAIDATITLRTLLFLSDITAELRFVRAWWSSFIFSFFVVS